jgi:hypothetical protein
MLPAAQALALGPVVAPTVPGDSLHAVSELDDQAVLVEAALVRGGEPVERRLAGGASRERRLGVREEPGERVGIGREAAEAERLGEAPEELLGRVRAAVAQRRPALVLGERREDVEERRAGTGRELPGLGDGRDEIHGAPRHRGGGREHGRGAAVGRAHQAVRRPPEGMLGPAGQEADRAAIAEGDPHRLQIPVAVPAKHGRDAAVRIDFQEAVPEGRVRIGPVERHRPVREDAPEGAAVRGDQVAGRRGARRALERRAKRVPVALPKARDQGRFQAGRQRSRVKRHDRPADHGRPSPARKRPSARPASLTSAVSRE